MAASPCAVGNSDDMVQAVIRTLGSRSQDDGSTRYQSHRTHTGQPPADFDASYRSTGETFAAQRGSLEHWLTARYCLYSSNRKGKLYRGEIDHPPWALSPASCEIRTNTMGSHLGFDFTGTPHLLHADAIDVHAWWATGCEGFGATRNRSE
ncbi:hypothetical protein K227x_40310 [Rubripirellula lacrimiformis]|uniref:Uncharacterized protein n=1 Tax=Rubripirellula lacrimiformis TaxID=1930273 RepID=A0A517NES2_9BACT|nr:DUF2071 domain-containing protein [Rubripirellula lacrimiformis]QDT05630.1 hypothetical protein K227x_40310 [Rubripirellula lacrimiformis]